MTAPDLATPRTDAVRRKWKEAFIGTIAQETLALSAKLERENAALVAACETALAVIGSLAPDHPPSAYVASKEKIIRAALALARQS